MNIYITYIKLEILFQGHFGNQQLPLNATHNSTFIKLHSYRSFFKITAI